jgi:uncharacterized protein (DUF488 family)
MSAGDQRVVYTLGHAGLGRAATHWLLEQFRVSHVLDIRLNPLRRARHHNQPEFELGQVAHWVVPTLLWRPALAGASLPLSEQQHLIRHERAWDGDLDWFEEQLLAGRLDRPIQQLCDHADSGARIVLLCSEADPRECHRHVLADELVRRGWDVEHLRAGGAVEPHPPIDKIKKRAVSA